MDLVTLAKCELFTEDGKTLLTHQLWKNNTAILVFIRHFACISCRAQAKELWLKREVYESKGAKLHFISNGNSEFIRGFKQDLGIEAAPVFTNPSLSAFKAAGFKRGFLASTGPRAILNARRMKKKHDLPQKYEEGMGDLWQLGGVLTIAKDGRKVFHHISEVLGDYPPEKDTLGADE
ncbi:MAG: hypothetical protein HRT45_03880 [Bdellovibrionales bacterium]|nr:hypothetical protein [Bdellovibrionales bacterium]